MEILALGRSFKEILAEHKLGEWQGSIRISESSTLIYYGPHAESMYSSLESALLSTHVRNYGDVLPVKPRKPAVCRRSWLEVCEDRGG